MARHVDTCKGCGGPKYVPHDEAVCVTVNLTEKLTTAQEEIARLRDLGTQLVEALRACEPRRHTDFCMAENHPGLPCSCPYETARAALAAAEQAGIR